MERANSAAIDSHFVACSWGGFFSLSSFASSASIQPSKNPHPFQKLLQEEEAEQAWQLISLWANCLIPSFREGSYKGNQRYYNFSCLVIKPLHLLCDSNHTKFLQILISSKQCFHRPSLELFHLPLLDSLCFQMEDQQLMRSITWTEQQPSRLHFTIKLFKVNQLRAG